MSILMPDFTIRFFRNISLRSEIRRRDTVVASEGTEFPEKIPHIEKEITSTAWQVLNHPVIHNGYIVYTEARMTGSIVLHLSWRSK
jgi:hypothetical protein